MLGGPDAGKSNYLFRLWLAIDQARGSLRKNGTPLDIQYLESGTRALLQGEFADHTSTDVHDLSPIPILYSSGGADQSGTLVVPDCAGEEWLSLYRKREWPNQWADFINENCAFLILVRVDSDQISAPLDWISCMKLLGQPPKESDESGETPTQVVLVDWLQGLRRIYTEQVSGKFRPRVGILVTAWDRVPEDRKQAGPEEYLNIEFPLLKQFIDTNDAQFDFAVFGVSIVGGDFKSDPDFKTEYLLQDPTQTGYVVRTIDGTHAKSPDLTLPVAWALGCDVF